MYSSIVLPFRNHDNVETDPVPSGFVRIAAEINVKRTLDDKLNKGGITRVAWFSVGQGCEISVWKGKQGFSFGDGYLDLPMWIADKMGILAPYASVKTAEGTFSKKEQNAMSIAHGTYCKCEGESCYLSF